jgi:ferritin-like metal-binding protein YciE
VKKPSAEEEESKRRNFKMKQKTMEGLFVEELKDLYDGEKQLIKALPKMAEAASSDTLRAAFEKHLEETKSQAERLEQIFKSRNEKPERKKCTGIAGIIEEGEDVIGSVDPSSLRDAGLIGAAQKVEHYEMAAYGTASSFAQRLGDTEAERLLRQTLEEEKAADKKLTQIAEAQVNKEAVRTGSAQM